MSWPCLELLYCGLTLVLAPEGNVISKVYSLCVGVFVILRSRVRSPALPDFLSSSGSGTGSTQPREPHEVN